MKRKPTGLLVSAAVSGWIVLIVDDKADNVTLARTALKFHGAEVYTASNGVEALEFLKTGRPTVILLDIRMPKMDGWTTFKAIRDNPDIATVPVIAITAFAMDGDEQRILETGFDGYISKPFDMLTFVAQIERVVTRCHKERANSTDGSR